MTELSVVRQGLSRLMYSWAEKGIWRIVTSGKPHYLKELKQAYLENIPTNHRVFWLRGKIDSLQDLAMQLANSGVTRLRRCVDNADIREEIKQHLIDQHNKDHIVFWVLEDGHKVAPEVVDFFNELLQWTHLKKHMISLEWWGNFQLQYIYEHGKLRSSLPEKHYHVCLTPPPKIEPKPIPLKKKTPTDSFILGAIAGAALTAVVLWALPDAKEQKISHLKPAVTDVKPESVPLAQKSIKAATSYSPMIEIATEHGDETPVESNMATIEEESKQELVDIDSTTSDIEVAPNQDDKSNNDDQITDLDSVDEQEFKSKELSSADDFEMLNSPESEQDGLEVDDSSIVTNQDNSTSSDLVEDEIVKSEILNWYESETTLASFVPFQADISKSLTIAEGEFYLSLGLYKQVDSVLEYFRKYKTQNQKFYLCYLPDFDRVILLSGPYYGYREAFNAHQQLEQAGASNSVIDRFTYPSLSCSK